MGRRIGQDPPQSQTVAMSPGTGRWIEDPVREGNLWRTLEVEVITPMFGGGHTAGTCDPETPISAKAIRGHLRFWWRAMHGAEDKTADELFKAETALFGSVEERSPVNVSVVVTQKGSEISASGLRNAHDSLAYVLFPFLARDANGSGRQGIKFDLCLSCPQHKRDELESALLAWLNFGGIGARTRRGCGALYCSEYAPPSFECDQLGPWFEKRVPFDANPTIRPWPILYRPFVIGQMNGGNAITAWSDAVAWMVRFRQRKELRAADAMSALNLGRRPPRSGNRPGRSCWPEAESIRNITGKRARRHEIDDSIPEECIRDDTDGDGNPIDGAFPRAAFGLPIGFKFHRDDSDDPKPTELVPTIRRGERETECGRMASRLILRPMRDQTGVFRAAFVLLRAQWPNGVRLIDKSDNVGARRIGLPWSRPFAGGSGAVIGDKARYAPPVQSAMRIAGITNASDFATDAVTAFLDYLCSKDVGFVEVSV